MSELVSNESMFELEPPTETGYRAYRYERYWLNSLMMNYGAFTTACEETGVSEETIRDRLEASPDFQFSYNWVLSRLKDMVRKEVFRRAVEPTERPVYNRGILVGKILDWDTKHLEWVAERLIPEEFHLPSRIEGGMDGEGTVRFKLELGPGVKEELDPG